MNNRPFPSSKKSHFQNEAKCEAIDMKIIFNYYANKTPFHNKGFALTLVLKVKFFGTRKWPIVYILHRRPSLLRILRSSSHPGLLFPFMIGVMVVIMSVTIIACRGHQSLCHVYSPMVSPSG